MAANSQTLDSRAAITTVAEQIATNNRLDQTRTVSYAKEVWSLAQSKYSKLEAMGCKKVSIQGHAQMIRRRHRRTLTPKSAGVVATPYKAHSWDRRLLMTNSFHDATLIDPDDISESQADLFGDVMAESANALGRLTDQVILDAIVAPVIVEKPPLTFTSDELSGSGAIGSTDAAQGDAQRRSQTGRIETQVKDVVFFVHGESSDSANAKIFEAADLDLVLQVFRKRNMDTVNLVCTLTPEMELLMRQDVQFQNAENRHNEGLGRISDVGSSFRYKGINFIPINEDALPVLQGSGVDAGVSNKFVLRGRNLKTRLTSAQSKGRLVSALPAAGASTGLGGAEMQDVELAHSEDVVFFWDGQAIYKTERPELSMQKRDENIELSHAQQSYMRVNMGAVCMDEDYVMVVPLRGTRTAN